jgi:bifunctional N-acetylglucosamine-1-phosphate-uridyltransferase/glucosamine-1-phosphate-acetyltransferase GlmU-like protein
MPPQISYSSSNFPHASEASTPFPNEVEYKIEEVVEIEVNWKIEEEHKIEEVVKIVVNCKIEEEVIGHFGGVLASFGLFLSKSSSISSSGLYVLRTF